MIPAIPASFPPEPWPAARHHDADPADSSSAARAPNPAETDDSPDAVLGYN